MTTPIDTIREALELLMAYVGCPPGDNATADAYRQGQRALEALSQLEQQPDTAKLVEAGDRMYYALRQYEIDVHERAREAHRKILLEWTAAKSAAPVPSKQPTDTEEALRVAMEYINAVRRGTTLRTISASVAMCDNPITAKMLEE